MNDQIFLQLSGFTYLLAMVFYMSSAIFKSIKIGYVATTLSVTGVLLGTVAFVIRISLLYKVSGSVLESIPIANLYESLQFFALLLMVIYLVSEFATKIKVLGIFSTCVAGILIILISSINAPADVKPLIPVLQSNWLIAHVLLSFIAYVFFTLSAIASIFYFILVSKGRQDPKYILWVTTVSILLTLLLSLIIHLIFKEILFISMYIGLFAVLFTSLLYYGKNIPYYLSSFSKDIDKLDRYIYNFTVLGFIIFTIGGLIFGAIWAENSWGRYWSWDPKETWAFITWLVYAFYLHARLYKRFDRSAVNAIAILGFIVTIFTFLGVNLLLSGLHSYGSN